MWKCKNCGEESEDAFDACWKCGAEKEISGKSVSDEEDITNVSDEVDLTHIIIRRYQDAYQVAYFIVGLGGFVKIVSLVGAVIALILIAVNRTDQDIGFIPFILAIISALILYLIGVVIAAQGQMLMASLDSAINSSPFLEQRDRIEAMGL